MPAIYKNHWRAHAELRRMVRPNRKCFMKTLKTQIAMCLTLLAATSSLLFLQDSVSAQEEAPKLETTLEKASYQIGIQIGTDLKRQGLDLDPKIIAIGIQTALSGKKSILSEDEIRGVFAEMQQEMKRKVAEKGTKNLEAGKKFLEENKKKEGVKTTKSGLQYLVIKEGTGATPTTDSTVSTHYRGRLIDGTIFDNSYEGEAPTAEDQPVSFGVTQVIKGWTEALQLMKVGAKYRLFIPSELAYGANGPGEIGANSVLIFDIELVNVSE